MVRDAIEIIVHFMISQGAVRGLIHNQFSRFCIKEYEVYHLIPQPVSVTITDKRMKR